MSSNRVESCETHDNQIDKGDQEDDRRGDQEDDRKGDQESLDEYVVMNFQAEEDERADQGNREDFQAQEDDRVDQGNGEDFQTTEDERANLENEDVNEYDFVNFQIEEDERPYREDEDIYEYENEENFQAEEDERAEQEDDDVDEYGFLNFEPEEVGDVSTDEEQPDRWAKAGFTNGLIPAPFERALLSGTTFSTWADFDAAVNEYEALSGFRFSRTKKKLYAARGVCRGWQKDNEDACKVEISARCMKKTGVITIRKVFLIHTCSNAIHKFRSGGNRTAWVARKVVNHVQINPNTPISKLKEIMCSFYHTSTQNWTIQRARMICRDQIVGGAKESFHKIPSYIAALRSVDPEGHAFYQTREERRFARLYIAPSSSMNTAKFCRPLVGLDGTHTSGKFPMILLFATCFDAENHIVILAWGVVNVENGDNWTWFCEHLKKSYPSFRGSKMVFISDRDKGLKVGVAEVFPECPHSHCLQHLRTNIKGNIDVACSKYFKKIAEARTTIEFEKLLTDFKPMNEKQQKFVAYVRQISPHLYARHAFPVPRYGHYTSNVVEIINQAVKPCRVLPVLLLSNYIWCYVMEKRYERAEHARQLPTSRFALTQYANNCLNRLYRESQGVRERKSSDNESLMVDNNGSWVVKINEKHCDCGYWQKYDFPCIHAIRLLANQEKECREYVGHVWHASTQRNAYSVVHPAVSIDQLPTSEFPCLEPIISIKRRGKQATKRKPSWGEQQARQSERLVKKQAQKCGRCRRPGHNARNCMYEPPRSVSVAPPQHRHGAAFAQGTSQLGHGSHETVRVGNTTTAQRPSTSHPWNLYHTRPSTQSYGEFIAEQDQTGTSASQVTQS